MTGTEHIANRGDTTPARTVAATSKAHGAINAPHPPQSTAQHITTIREGAAMHTPHLNPSLHLQVDTRGHTSYEQDPHAARAPAAASVSEAVTPFATVKRLVTRALPPIGETLESLAFWFAYWLGRCFGSVRRFVHDFPRAVYATTIGSIFFLTLLIVETTEK
jgi:hypothetical protein